MYQYTEREVTTFHTESIVFRIRKLFYKLSYLKPMSPIIGVWITYSINHLSIQKWKVHRRGRGPVHMASSLEEVANHYRESA